MKRFGPKKGLCYEILSDHNEHPAVAADVESLSPDAASKFAGESVANENPQQ